MSLRAPSLTMSPAGLLRGAGVSAELPTLLLILLLGATVRCMDVTIKDPEILYPTKWGNRELALLVVPEENVKSEAYRDIGRAIQYTSPFRLWVAILNFTNRSFNKVPLAIADTLHRLNINGMKTTEIFLAGHGHGGVLVQMYTQMVPDILKGVILLSSYLTRSQRPAEFPVPFLTLSGDLDGVARITRSASSFRELQLDVEEDADEIYRSPMVILQGANHGSLISTTLPEALADLDLDPEVSGEEARSMAANYTSWFMMSTLSDPASFTVLARLKLRSAYENTKEIMKPILAVHDLIQSPEYTSPWSRISQIWISGLRGLESARLWVSSFVIGDNYAVVPLITEDKGNVYATTYTELVGFPPIVDDGSKKQAPIEMKMRLKTAEAIQGLLVNSTVYHRITCKDLNYAAFMTGYHEASKLARDRYDKRHKGIQFHDDVIVQTEEEWDRRHLVVDMVKHEAHVTAVAWKSPLSHEPSHLAGMYYCRLLPPSRVIEWIYVDSLKYNGEL
ncbi:uncharacterized protein LOC135468367 isoform X2 [Liolophura sinensis]|uniref:uncharacterized protein LOC135468367 isoform X2 n=1 Tax=Liolophura sinensis TaxID=3198878 RepID=UPI0031590290